MDDWQDAAFQNRHVHNRIGRKGRVKGQKAAAVFDVMKTFGTYDIKCTAADKISREANTEVPASRLEIYRLNGQGNALICELWLSNVLHASALLAASRKTMNSVLQDLVIQSKAVGKGETSQETLCKEAENSTTATSKDDVGCEKLENDPHSLSDIQDEEGGEEEEDEDDEAEEDPITRFKTFEKNSFRSPKFWLRWQGHVVQQPGSDEEENMDTGPGYVVFSGNDCNTFQGTISCEVFGWKDVKMTGRKTASRSTRDVAVSWQASET